jgi:hypothetical protein
VNAKSSRDNPVAEPSFQTPTGLSELLYDLIDACVMECYFREHMVERDLLFHDLVAPHLEGWDKVDGVDGAARPNSSTPEHGQAARATFLTHLHATLNAPGTPSAQLLARRYRRPARGSPHNARDETP